MPYTRWNAIAELKTVLDTLSEVNTVVRSYMDLDITQYTASQLPLIMIREPAEEADEELTSMRQMIVMSTVLRTYFVHWGENPDTTYKELMSAIRNKVGDNPTLNSKSTATWISEVSPVDGELPLYFFECRLHMKYYLDMRST